MKCVFLFLLINLVVMLVLGIVLFIVMSVLGISYCSLGGILVILIVFGFGGLFILLFMLKWMVKKLIGVYVIE